MSVLSIDDYFMGVALLSAFRSEDPHTNVGSCIVDQKNRIVGIGYNDFPTGCNDGSLPWQGEGEYLETKYPYVCHSELNAIFNSIGDLNGCKIYLKLFPCNDCAKAIIQVGIREIIYQNYNKSPESETFIAARRLLDLGGVKYRKFEPSIEKLTIYYDVNQKTDGVYMSPKGEVGGLYPNKS